MVSRSTGPMESLAMLSREETGPEEKIKAYNFFTECVKQESGKNVGREIQNNISSVYDAMMSDITKENALLANAALQALGAGLHDNSTVEAFMDGRAKEITSALCKVISTTGDKLTCTRALWCLATQNFADEVISSHVTDIMSALTTAQASTSIFTMIVEHEAINLIIKLLEQVQDEMTAHVSSWAKLVYKTLVHTSPKIRERAMVAAEIALPIFMKESDKLAAGLAADLKSGLLSGLTTLLSSQHEMFALHVWRIYISILGKTLHHGHLINSVLPIVEKAFKNSNHDVKCEAYLSWKTLVDNFSLDPNIVSDVKRVKLIMQVFRINNAKSEKVALTKLDVWWHFAQQLEGKLVTNLDSVISPLLHFCMGGGAIHAANNKPMTPKAFTPGSINRAGFASPSPHISIGSGSGHAPLAFSVIRHRGFEILARLLGTETNTAAFKMAALRAEFPVTVTLFTKHGPLFIQTFSELVTHLGAEAPGSLVNDVWYSLVAHTKNVLEHLQGGKREGVEVLSALVNGLRHIVNTQALNTEQVLTLLSATVCLPAKILGSVAYNIGTSQTEIMQGCPALVLAEILFHHRNVEVCGSHEKFFTILHKIMECGLAHLAQFLSFSHTMLQLVDVACRSIENIETGWRMWSAVANPLLQHIVKTNEVNQGDTLEHDFSCMYLALHCPLNRLLKPDLPQATVKTLLKTWAEFYVTFNRLAAMVANVDANVQNEELCSKILGSTTLDKLKDDVYVEGLIQCCVVISEHIDFSAFSNQSNPFSFGATGMMSPSRYAKRRQKPLGHLTSFVKLVAMLLDSLVEINNKISTSEVPFKYSGSLSNASSSVIAILSILFAHMSSSVMIESAITALGPSMMHLFDGAKKSSSKMYSQPLLQKLEKLWQEITTCIQGRFNGIYNSEFLTELSPLLEATFLHPRRAIKNQTVMFWTATFAHAPSLTYPENLKPILATVKQKAVLVLPGWDDAQITIIEDTSVSQISQAESQVPAPQIVGIPSPVKQRGSFMNRECSPNIKNSPLRPAKSPSAANSARKVLSVDDMNSRDFTVITPTSAKRKRVLTDHQKEVLKEKSALPAMYNNLDTSQDVSLMSQFNGGSDSQMSMQSPLPTPTFDFANPGFPIILPTKKQKLNDESAKTTESVVIGTDVVVKSEMSNAKNSPAKTTLSNVKRRRSVRFAVDEESKDNASSGASTNPEKLQAPSKHLTDTKEEQDSPKETEKITDKSVDAETLPSRRSLRSREKESGGDDAPVKVKTESVVESGEIDKNDSTSGQQLSESSDQDKASKDINQKVAPNAVAKDSPLKRSLRVRQTEFSKTANVAKGSGPDASMSDKSNKKDMKDKTVVLVEDTEMMDSEVSQSVLQPNLPKPRDQIEPIQVDETQSEVVVIETQSLAVNKYPDSSMEVLSGVPQDEDKTKQDEAASNRENIASEDCPSSQDEGVSLSQNSSKKGRKGEQASRRRSRSSAKASLTASPKSPSRLGSIESWLIKSPRKIEEKTEKAAVITFAEETEPFSPDKENAFRENDKTDKDTFVNETPVKIEKDCVIEDSQEKADSAKTLFGKVLQETPDKQQVPANCSPVVKLVGLSPVEIEAATLGKSIDASSLTPTLNETRLKSQAEKSGSDSDGSVAGQKSRRRKSGIQRRSSLLRFSKAATTPSSQTEVESKEINLDDIVPSSQDAFASQAKSHQSGVATSETVDRNDSQEKPGVILIEDSEAVLASQTKQIGDSEMDVDEDTGDKSNANGTLVEVDPADSEQSDALPGNTAGGGEDAVSADIDTASSQDSQATIITKPKRRKSKTALDRLKKEELPESSQSQDTEASPRRTKRAHKKKKCSCPNAHEIGHDHDSLSIDSPDVASSLDSSQDSAIESGNNESVKKPRGRSKKQSEKKIEPGATLTNDISSLPSSQGNNKSKSKKSITKDADILENIVNKQCNLDSDSDSDDDVPLNQLNASKSEDDDVPLKQLLTKSGNSSLSKAVNAHEGDEKPSENPEPSSCADLFENSGPTTKEKSVKDGADENEGDVSIETADASLNDSGSAEDCQILSSSQKKKRMNKRKGLDALSASLAIDMKVDGQKSLRSNTSTRSQSSRQLKKVSPKRRASLKLKRGSKVVTVTPRDSLKNKKHGASSPADCDTKQKLDSGVSEQEKEDTSCDKGDVMVNELEDGNEDHVVKNHEDSDIDSHKDGKNEGNRVENDCEPMVEIDEDGANTDDNLDANVVETAKESGSAVDGDNMGTGDDIRTLPEDVPVQKNGSNVGSKDISSNDVQSPKTVVSPPKKGKPFDMPETPTSATKHRSRASMILERARIICMNKNQVSGNVNRRRFTAIRPTGPGSPRTIFQSRPSGILKQSSESPKKEGQLSPPRDGVPGSPSFRPVHMPRVYSPSASPSAGILKKRKLCMLNGPFGTDSPSPPNKHRRVSFNEEIEVCTSSESREGSRPVNRCLELARGTLTQSPLVLTTSAASKVVSGQTRFLTTPSSSFKLDKAVTEEINTAFAVPKAVIRQRESQLSSSQASAASTQESQLNATAPIFPELASCSVPVDQILPQLTSSMWIRGLGQLVRARSIRTIGDLCSLSEFDVHNLPIRSPKVTTMRKVLQQYQQQHSSKKSSAAVTEDGTDSNSVDSDLDSLPSASTSPVKTLPQLEDELRKMSPIKGDLDTSLESEVSLNLETSSNEVGTPRIQEDLDLHHIMDDPAITRVNLVKSKSTKKSLVKDIESMAAAMTPDNLALLPSNQLVQIHQNLNTMMMNVVMALKEKCPVSPNGSSQSSQESSSNSGSQ